MTIQHYSGIILCNPDGSIMSECCCEEGGVCDCCACCQEYVMAIRMPDESKPGGWFYWPLANLYGGRTCVWGGQTGHKNANWGLYDTYSITKTDGKWRASFSIYESNGSSVPPTTASFETSTAVGSDCCPPSFYAGGWSAANYHEPLGLVHETP